MGSGAGKLYRFRMADGKNEREVTRAQTGCPVALRTTLRLENNTM